MANIDNDKMWASILRVFNEYQSSNTLSYTAYTQGLREQGLEFNGKDIVPIKHKLKAGDWVVDDDGRIGRIIECTKDFADVDLEFSRLSTSPNNIRSWTIQDAKDGDVLVSESALGTWYCIFKSLEDEESMTVHCYISRSGDFKAKKELCFDKDPSDVCPATKEQREQLEKAMFDAGYEWDADKKELKKLGQSEVTKESDQEELNEFERYIERITNVCIEDRKKYTNKRIKGFSKDLLDIAHKQFIEEACEWLKENAEDYIGTCYDKKGRPTNETYLPRIFFEDFRKALEKGE